MGEVHYVKKKSTGTIFLCRRCPKLLSYKGNRPGTFLMASEECRRGFIGQVDLRRPTQPAFAVEKLVGIHREILMITALHRHVLDGRPVYKKHKRPFSQSREVSKILKWCTMAPGKTF